MKKITLIALTMATLCSCAPPPKRALQDLKVGNNITIFSAENLTEAQSRADQLCGSHAYFISDHRPKIPSPDGDLYGVRYNCNVADAALDGSSEARGIQYDKDVESYRQYIGTTERIKEARRKRADPKHYESYTETDSYGNVRTYSFFNGQTCEATVTASGSAETHCD